MEDFERKNEKTLRDIVTTVLATISGSFESLRVVVKYGISGGIGMATNLISIYVLTDIIKLWHIISAFIAFLISFVVSFILQKYWTFGGRGMHPTHHQVVLYMIVALGGLVANIVLLYLFTDIFGFWYFGVQSAVIVVIAFTNFVINKNITFKEEGTQNKDV